MGYGSPWYIKTVVRQKWTTTFEVFVFYLTNSPSTQAKLAETAPAMKALIIFAVLVSAAIAQYAPVEQYAPIPYSFNYISETEDGGSGGHQESGDGAGRVTGSYTVNNLEGHTRIVDYVADENGFRASIRTNEPGTASSNPADVTIESSAPQDGGAFGYGGGGGAPAAPAGGYFPVPSNYPRASGYGY